LCSPISTALDSAACLRSGYMRLAQTDLHTKL
jgi:hypothetical protein